MDNLVTTNPVDSSLITVPPIGVTTNPVDSSLVTVLPGGLVNLNPVASELTALYGTDGDDVIEADESGSIIFGLAGDDLIYGGIGNDDISGNAGDDTLFSGYGNDSLFGNEGNDWLSGGYGRDVLTGGDGEDTFEFKSRYITPNSTIGEVEGIDKITDYTGEDKIEIDRYSFGIDFDRLNGNFPLYEVVTGPPSIFDGLNASESPLGSSITTFGYSTDGGLYYDLDGAGLVFTFHKFSQIVGAPESINLYVE